MVRQRVLVRRAHIVHPLARPGSVQSCRLTGPDYVAASRANRARRLGYLIFTRALIPLREVFLFEIAGHPRDGSAGSHIRPRPAHSGECTPEMQVVISCSATKG